MKNIPLKHLSGFYPYSLTGKISNFIFRSSMFESLLGYCDYGRLGNAADCGSALYGLPNVLLWHVIFWLQDINVTASKIQ